MNIKKPLIAQWDITQGCNFKCEFCLSSSGKKSKTELSTEKALGLVSELRIIGVYFLRILGGDPFFREDIEVILKHAADNGMFIAFSTNGSLFNESNVALISEIRDSIQYLQVSLYGFDEESYWKNTKNPSSYKKVMYGLNLLRDIDIKYSCLVVCNDGKIGNLDKYYKLAKYGNAVEFRVVPEISLGRISEKYSFYSQNKIDVVLKELKNIQTKNEKGPKILFQARPLLGEYIFNNYNINTFYQPCQAATQMIYINAEGVIYPCPFIEHMPQKLKDVYQEIQGFKINSFSDLLNTWESDNFNYFRSLSTPQKNKFAINVNCKFYKEKKCIPCTLTPCDCIKQIEVLKSPYKILA